MNKKHLKTAATGVLAMFGGNTARRLVGQSGVLGFAAAVGGAFAGVMIAQKLL